MLRKFVFSFVLAASVFVAGCHHKVQNPIANIDSKQPDKVLFDRAMDAMKHGKYSVARTLLETLINTYPDSEYVARAKLTMGDAWYAEGGTAGLQQAEVQYKDFITFFPNMPEAAEAQLKVANIHYKQMEKPDRDYTQAMRAADEYKSLITQFPDSKLVPEAKERLREVQEVLADRESRIAHFYYLRNNLAAAQARFLSLIDSYPLYSGASETLFALGTIYEKEADGMRHSPKMPEVAKARYAAEYDQKAIEAYSKIITRYPAQLYADYARKKLVSMKAPVPQPTPEALAESKAEEESRTDVTRFKALVGNFRKHPDVSRAAKTGDPDMAEEEIASAPAVVQQFEKQMKEANGVDTGTQKVGLEGVKAGKGEPAANEPPPSSQPTPPSGSADTTKGSPSTNQTQTNSTQSTASAGSQTAQQPATMPARVNEIGSASEGATSSPNQTAQNAQNGQNNQDQKSKDDSSSKKKKKKGLRKLVPF